MLRFYLKCVALFIVLCCFRINSIHAAVVVTAPSNGTCIEKTPGNFKTLDNITIIEGDKGDFPTQNNRTIILTCPAGFEFNPGIGSVQMGIPLPSVNMTAAAISVSSSAITLTISVSGTNKWDSIAVVGIQVRALSYNITGHILRLAGAAGGNATVSGDDGGAGISHGYLVAEGTGSNSTIANGNWTNPAIWSDGVIPNCGDTVFIYHTVNVDAASRAEFLYIQNTGYLIADNPVTVDAVFVINGAGTYEHKNNVDPTFNIFNGTETFSTTSTVIVSRWFSTTQPLPYAVSGNFGNVTFRVGNNWAQQGLFAPNRIKGTLTVSSGTITMDNGVGLTTFLQLQDVVVNGTGALRMNTGANRNFTLITNNYTDISTSVTRSSMQLNCIGNLTWTANGNVYISHTWSAYQHTAANPGNTNITINGDLTIAGGAFDINSTVNAPVNLTITGNTTITGTPSYVRFIDNGSNPLNFTTTNFYVSGGSVNELMGGNVPTGNATINVLNDFIVSGSSTSISLVNNSTGTNATVLNTTRDLVITDGALTVANTNGTYTATIGRNLQVFNSSGRFNGQLNSACTQSSTVNITGYLQVNTGYFQVSQGLGNITLAVTEDIMLNNGNFYGINNTAASNNGSASMSCSNIDFNGGVFIFINTVISDGKTVTVSCNTDADINFMNATDIFAFISLTGSNNALLDLQIGNNLTIGGNFPGAYFMSSSSSGNERITIGGNFAVNGGDVYFVGNAGSFANSHNIKTTIAGDLLITDGHTRLSSGAGTDTILIGGNVDLSGGIISQKLSTGRSRMIISGTYTQTAGNYHIHAGSLITPDTSYVTVTDDFSLTGGIFNFDKHSAASGLAEHQLILLGSDFTIGGNAVITHANNLTTNLVFGQVYFNRAGTTVIHRTSSTNNICHVRYTISAATTADASASPHGFQMTSVGSSVGNDHTALHLYGTLDMGSNELYSRQQPGYYSRIIVYHNGRYRTSHTGGFYAANASAPSSVNGFISGFNRVNYLLYTNSIVEYYGTSTGIITGIPNGTASTISQKYGILEINFTGAAGSAWLYPETTGEVFIRTELRLTEGEFNLDNDHVTNTGGRYITMESASSMTRTNGFIRSETEDGSGLVRWDVTSNGSRVFHFGYDASTYIPFTFQQTSGSAGMIAIGTYRTIPDNTPYPPTVTHVRDVMGNDNSGYTVDRFWHITVPGNADANLTYTYAPSEGGGILSPRAQQWEPVSAGWFPPAGVQTNPTAVTTSASGISSFNTWWTLSAAASPLPIELLAFEVAKKEEDVLISWATATEINNDYFTIEKSRDGSIFETVSVIPGAGNSTSVKYYELTDESPYNGRSYYRLKQTDYDGTSTYSDIKSIYFGRKGTYSFYPNPATILSELQIEVPDAGVYSVNVFDSHGKLVAENNYEVKDARIIQLNNKNLSAGLYYLKIVSAGEEFSEKLLIK